MRCAAAALCLALAAAAAGQAQSTPPPSTQAPQISDTLAPAALDYVVQYPLFGNLAWRRKLKSKGIELTAHYVSETASNGGQGGRRSGTAYAQQVDFGVGLDLGKLGVWSGATARFAMTDRVGRSLAADKTGALLSYQEIFGQGQNLRFNEISLEKALAGGGASLKLGFYPMGNDFATLPYVCNFQNVGLCGHPQSLPTDSGWSDAPAGRWGARLMVKLSNQAQVRLGAFDVNPTITARQNGFKLGFDGSTGAIVPVEFDYLIGRKPSDYGGVYKIGAYYDTSEAPDLADPARRRRGRYGLYLMAAQQVFKTGPDHRHGLALFGVWTIADKATAKFSRYYEAGAAYRGLIPGRDLDLVSLGWTRADINSRYRDYLLRTGAPPQTDEQIVEFTYTFQATPSLSLRPGVQYDVHPGALASRPNAWVGGLQLKLTL